MSKKEIINVELDWFPNTNHIGFLLAEKKGYFAEENLEVKIGGVVHGDIFEDESDIVVSPEPALLKVMNEGWDLTAVAVLTQSSDSGIVSLKEEGITSPKKLEGKRLSHWAPKWFHSTLRKALELDGGDYSKVKLVQKDVGDIVATLGTEVDATWVYANWECFDLTYAGKEINFFNLADVDPLFNFPAPAISASAKMINERPDQLRGFLKALARGYEEGAAKPEESARLCQDMLPKTASIEMLIESQKHLAPLFLDAEGHWGKIDPVRWEPFSKFMRDEGLIKDFKKVEFTNEFLPY